MCQCSSFSLYQNVFWTRNLEFDVRIQLVAFKKSISSFKNVLLHSGLSVSLTCSIILNCHASILHDNYNHPLILSETRWTHCRSQVCPVVLTHERLSYMRHFTNRILSYNEIRFGWNSLGWNMLIFAFQTVNKHV